MPATTNTPLQRPLRLPIHHHLHHHLIFTASSITPTSIVITTISPKHKHASLFYSPRSCLRGPHPCHRHPPARSALYSRLIPLLSRPTYPVLTPTVRHLHRPVRPDLRARNCRRGRPSWHRTMHQLRVRLYFFLSTPFPVARY